MALLASVTIVPCTGAPRCSRTWPRHREMQQVGSCPFHFQTEGKRIPKQAPKRFKWGLQAPCWDVLALAEVLGTNMQMDAWTAASPPRQEPGISSRLLRKFVSKEFGRRPRAKCSQGPRDSGGTRQEHPHPQKGRFGGKSSVPRRWVGKSAMKPSAHLPLHKSLYGSVSYTLTAP